MPFMSSRECPSSCNLLRDFYHGCMLDFSNAFSVSIEVIFLSLLIWMVNYCDNFSSIVPLCILRIKLLFGYDILSLLYISGFHLLCVCGVCIALEILTFNFLFSKLFSFGKQLFWPHKMSWEVPSSSIFWKSLCRIGTISSLSAWWKSLVKPSGLLEVFLFGIFFMLMFLTLNLSYLIKAMQVIYFFLSERL